MRYREILEACWKGYQKKGMKTMFGKRYPNCVKKTKSNEGVVNEFAADPDGEDDNNVPDRILTLANRWWNAGDKQPQIANVLRSLGWSIAQVDSEDDAVQLMHNDGTTYFISADDFDPEVFEQEQLAEKCWDGYTQQGMKKKGDRQVPNCVPVSEQQMEEDLKKWFKEKWVRFGPDGKIRGDCARGSSSEGKPKCLPQSKAHALGKKGRASAAAKKRREDPDPERRGAAKNVATKVKETLQNKSSDEIRRIQQMLNVKFDANLDVDGVLGPLTMKSIEKFLPKAQAMSAPDPTRNTAVQGKELKLDEKQDACYNKVKSRYKVWPSAYASGALVQCRKKGAANWGNKTKK